LTIGYLIGYGDHYAKTLRDKPNRRRMGNPEPILKRALYRDTTKTRAHPRHYPLREITNAILYILKTGCQWRQLPNDLPP